MDVVAAVSAIQKIDDDLVPNFCANDRAEDSQPVRLGLRSSESVICIFDKTALRKLYLQGARGVMPSYVLRRNVVVPGCCKTRAIGEEDKPQPQPKRSLDFHRIHYPTGRIV